MTASLLLSLDQLRDRMGRYDYYRALFKHGIHPDEIWNSPKGEPLESDLQGRIQTFLDANP